MRAASSPLTTGRRSLNAAYDAVKGAMAGWNLGLAADIDLLPGAVKVAGLAVKALAGKALAGRLASARCFSRAKEADLDSSRAKRTTGQGATAKAIKGRPITSSRPR
jgi:hypothetical protein